MSGGSTRAVRSARRRRTARAAGVAAVLGILLVLLVPGVPLGAPRAPAAPGPEGRPAAALREGPVPAVYAPAVTETIDLVANRTYPGEAVPAEQDEPGEIYAFPSSEQLFVRGYLGNALSVLNTTSDHVIATLTVGYSEGPGYPTMAGDPATHQLLVTNLNDANISVIDVRTDALLRTIDVGGSPSGILFDPTNSEFYVANYGTDVVTAIAANDTPVATIPVGSHPESLVLDPTDGSLFVANVGNEASTANLTVINTSENRPIDSVLVGTRPTALAYSPVGDLVTAANLGSYNLTEIDGATDARVATLSVGAGLPAALSYDPVQEELFVADEISNNLTVVNESTGKAVATVAVGTTPDAVLYDGVDGRVYVADSEGGEVSVVDAATRVVLLNLTTVLDPTCLAAQGSLVYIPTAGSSLVEPNVSVVAAGASRAKATIPLAISPQGITYDAASGRLDVVDTYGNTTRAVDPSTGGTVAVGAVGDEPTLSALDPADDDLFVVNSATANLTVLSPTLAPVGSIAIGGLPESIAYDSADGDLYVANGFGNVTVVNGSGRDVVGSIEVDAFAELSAIVYDPHNGLLYVADATGDNVTVIDPANGSLVARIGVGLEPLALAFDALNDTIFVANYGSGNLSVIADRSETVETTLLGSGANFLVYDAALNALLSLGRYSTALVAMNASSYVSLGAPLDLGDVSPGGLAVDPTTGALYVSLEYAGALLEVTPVPAPTYPVTFNETGLPLGANWTVLVGPERESSTGTSIGFSLADGEYAYSVPAVGAYLPNVTVGLLNVSGEPLTIRVAFSPMGLPLYPVTFEETGLADGTNWSVTLGGATNASNTSAIGFREPIGLFAYTVGSVAGYLPDPTAGTANVTSAGASLDVAFTATGPSAAFSVTLLANVSSLTLGGSVLFTTDVDGGIGPFSYLYQLPAGCASANRSTVACRPSTVGHYEVRVAVTDAAHAVRNATSNLSVVASACSACGPAPATGPLSPLDLGAIAAAIVLLLVAVVVLLARRRRTGTPPPPGPRVSGPAPEEPPPDVL